MSFQRLIMLKRLTKKISHFLSGFQPAAHDKKAQKIIPPRFVYYGTNRAKKKQNN